KTVGTQTLRADGATAIRYALPANLGSGSVRVSLEIFDVAGELVRRVDFGGQTTGKYHYGDWDGKNEDGQTVASRVDVGRRDDVNAVSWNAAGLAGLKKNEFVGMRAQLFQDLEYNYFAFAHPTQSHGTFAVALNNLNVTGIEQRAADTDAPDSTFSSNDTAYT